METCKVRVWVYVRGWVRLTLTPGQTLRHSYGGPHEEGYSRTYNEWQHTFTGQIISRYHSEGTDCDGRHSESFDSILTRNPNREPLEPSINDSGSAWEAFRATVPQWDEISFSQRDHYAEAMGY